MYRSLVRSGALAASVIGLTSVELRAEPNDHCALMTRDLRGQIEAMKLLKAKATPLRFDDSSNPPFQFDDPLKSSHHQNKPSKKSKAEESPKALMARNRAQAEALNDMLPGMGCASLDIDRELAQPSNAALLPEDDARKHHKR